MDAYNRWLLRSRLILFLGAILLIGPTLDGFEFDFASKLKIALHAVGLIFLIVGLLDCLGFIAGKEVKEAIREHNANRRKK